MGKKNTAKFECKFTARPINQKYSREEGGGEGTADSLECTDTSIHEDSSLDRQ